RDDFVQTYERELPAVVQCFRDDFEACIAHLRFPLRHRRVVRTTNLLERLFLEERRRTKIIPNAFGERPVLKLMYAAVIRAAERWRGTTVGEFEQRQLRAIRDELGRAHAERVAPAITAKAMPPIRKLRAGNALGSELTGVISGTPPFRRDGCLTRFAAGHSTPCLSAIDRPISPSAATRPSD